MPLALLAGAGCATVSSSPRERPIAASVVGADALGRREASVLMMPLVPVDFPAPPGGADSVPLPAVVGRAGATDKAVQPVGSLRVVVGNDDDLEYQLTIYNDARRTFRAARVYRGDPATGGKMVATLFSDLSLSSRYIQIRGTARIGSLPEARDLATQLRDHPADFVFRIEPRVLGMGALVGTIH